MYLLSGDNALVRPACLQSCNPEQTRQDPLVLPQSKSGPRSFVQGFQAIGRLVTLVCYALHLHVTQHAGSANLLRELFNGTVSL